MSHTRLHFDDPISAGAIVRLGAEQARYVGRVLRSRPGDAVSVFNAEDGEWRAVIERIGKNDATLRIVERIVAETESPLAVHLVQGVSRGERMDFVVQKATELGVMRITPVLTDHGMVRLSGDRLQKRQAHWQSVAVSACEQSGRIRPPVVDVPVRLNDWFGQAASENALRLILKPGTADSLVDRDAPSSGLCLLVGPEGGFSEREYEDATIAGFEAVGMGPRVLRTETAAVAAVAIVQSQWGDLQN